MEQGESLYKAIFEYSQDGIFACHLTEDNLPDRFIEANTAMCEELGYTKNELLQLKPSDLFGQQMLSHVKARLSPESRILFEADCKTRRGSDFPVEITAHIVETGGQRLLVGIARNIYARRQSEQALIDALPDMTFRLTSDGVIIHACPGTQLGWLIDEERLIGKNLSKVLPERVASLTLHRIASALSAKSVQTYEYRMPINGIQHIWEVRMVVSGEDEVLAIVRDITERKRQERRLKYLSLHDSLTGIYNRAFIEQEMNCIQQDGRGPVGIVMCDVDRLKHVNDTLGHSSGDSLLVTAARIIKKAVRKGDIVARIGGDEFAILLPRGDLAAARRVYERIQEITARHNDENPRMPVSMSVGYAACSNGLMSMADLLREADLNMYQEKMLRCRI